MLAIFRFKYGILFFLILLPSCHQIALNALFKGKIGGSKVAAKITTILIFFSFGVILFSFGVILFSFGVLYFLLVTYILTEYKSYTYWS